MNEVDSSTQVEDERRFKKPCCPAHHMENASRRSLNGTTPPPMGLQAWAEKIKNGGYAVIDVGLDPKYANVGNTDKGPFYTMETHELFGD